MTVPSSPKASGRTVHCPACREDRVRPWATKNGYAILKCRLCGHGFVNPPPAPEIQTALYAEHGNGGTQDDNTVNHILESERRFPNTTLDASRMVAGAASILGRVRKGEESGTMLDIGCGYGFTSRVAAMAGFQVTALEPASFERQVASAITGFEPLPVSFESYEEKEKFDVVIMSQVIEHALDINLWVAKAWRLLNDDGVLVLAMPNFENIVCVLFRERDPYVSPPQHLNYFTTKSIAALLRRHGFDAVRVEGISRLGPRTTLKHLPHLPQSPAVIGAVRMLQDFPFKVCGWFGFPIMLNVYARKFGVEAKTEHISRVPTYTGKRLWRKSQPFTPDTGMRRGAA